MDELQAAKPIDIPDIAPLSDTFSLVLYWTGGDYADRNYNARVSWEDLFAILAPGLEDSPSDGAIAQILAAAIYRKCTHQAKAPHRISMNRDDLSTVRIQLQSHGLVDITQVETAKGMRHLVWSLTGKGRELMVKLRVVRNADA